MTPAGYTVLRRQTIALASPDPSSSYSTVLAQMLDALAWGSGALQVRVFAQDIVGVSSSVRIAVYNVVAAPDDPAVMFESADPIAYVDLAPITSTTPQLLIAKLPTVSDPSFTIARYLTVKMIVNAGPNSISGSVTLGVDLIGYRGMAGPRGTAGTNAYSTSTQSFTAPAANSTATLFAGDCTWAAAGQRVFLSDAVNGVTSYFRVAANGSATSVSLGNEDVAQAGFVFATGSKLSPAGEDGLPNPGAFASMYKGALNTSTTPLTSYSGNNLTASGATTSTAAGSITVAAAGAYRVSADILAQFGGPSQGAANCYLVMTLNGTLIGGTDQTVSVPIAGAVANLNREVVLNLAANDVLKVEYALGTGCSFVDFWGTFTADACAGGGASNDAQYLTLATNASLANERVLALNATKFSTTDGGAGGNYSVDLTGNFGSTNISTTGFVGVGATPRATVGLIRAGSPATVGNRTVVAVRNAADSADLEVLTVGASNEVTLGAPNGTATYIYGGSANAYFQITATTMELDTPSGGGFMIARTTPTYHESFYVDPNADRMYIGSMPWQGAVALSGNIAVKNSTTILAARDAADSADIPIVATDASNNILIGSNPTGSAYAPAGAYLAVNNDHYIGVTQTYVTLFGNDINVHTAGELNVRTAAAATRIVLDPNNIFVSIGATPAASGVLRLPNATAINARNAAGGADVEMLSTDANDNVKVGGKYVAGMFLQSTLLTSGTSFTTNSKTTKIRVRVVGGGGGGGGAGGATSNGSAGAGGGAGGYAEKWFNVAGNTGYTCAIGAAGSGGTASAGTGNAGGNGGSSSLTVSGTTVTAPGGSGGAGMSSGTTVIMALGGAAAAVATNGDVNSGGTGGANSYRGSAAIVFAGQGAGSQLGGGGSARSTSGVGNAATGFGAGGGGGCVNNANQNNAGGAGTAGCIVVEEYA
jgi:hypothetical protein